MSVKRQALGFLDFSGVRRDGERVHSIVPQFDGSEFASQNCAAASEAVRDIANVQGHAAPGSPWPPTGASIRRGTGDRMGGLDPFQTAAVSKAHYNIGKDIRIADWNTVTALLWSRVSVTVLIRYGAIADAGHSGSPGFRGNHSARLHGIRQMDDGSVDVLFLDSLADGRRAGIPKGPQWISIGVLRRATGDLVLGDGVTLRERFGSNKAYISANTVPYKPPPEPATVTLRFGAHRVKAKRLRCRLDNTIVRSSPRRVAGNHVRLVDRGDTFDAYQRVNNSFGSWVGNRAGTRWVMRGGFTFVRYI